MDISTFSYQQAIETLTSQGKFYINLGLERVGRVLELFGNPQDELKIIHVAGTNGKGSTCAILSSILTKSGYKTGIYTSPHLFDYTERIKINDENIAKDDFAKLVFQVIEISEKNNIHLTEFEVLTVMAFLYFKEKQVDIICLETGLGGRLDATNIIKSPLVSIITSIDFDHTDRLGDTIEKIAYEKAGIIKENIPVITLKNNLGLNVIQEISSKKFSCLYLADESECKLTKDFKVQFNKNEYDFPLMGLWQQKNLSLCITAINLLNKLGIFIPEKAIRSGLKNVCWPGRMEYIKDKSLIFDGAHNPSGAKLLVESLDFYFPEKKRIWIYSCLNTKDYESIIKILFTQNDIVICTKSSMKSAVDPKVLKQKIYCITGNKNIHVADTVSKAINLAGHFSINENVTIVCGSLYTLGELSNFSHN